MINLPEDGEKEPNVQENARTIAEAIRQLLSNAKDSEFSDAMKPFTTSIKPEEKANNNITKPSTDEKTVKTLQIIKTDTFLDQMFLNQNEQILGGIPSVSNSILVGLPSSGKSLFIAELALRLANNGKKTIFCTSEDAWRTESSRYDLESRFREKAKILGLNWETISQNLFVLDVISHSELRNWDCFISTYRSIVEKEKAEILLVDSLTQLEDARGAVKLRLLEMCRYNQNHGITAIFISQRAIDEPDGLAFSGGLAIGYSCDIVFELDFKKAWSGDSSLKLDTGCKQGDIVYFFRILKNRLCKYKANYFAYSITPEGLIRLQDKTDLGNIEERKKRGDDLR